MINALGPETPATLGSFWPPEVARVIAADQAGQTPSGLTPPAPAAASRPPAERTPTALATPAPGPGGGATGHAPMLSDGYYAAAAQGRATPTPAPCARRRRRRHCRPPTPGPQSGGQATRRAGARRADAGRAGDIRAGGVRPAGSRDPGVPGTAGHVRGPGRLVPEPGGAYPGQGGSYPGQQDALAQYAPGRRKPASAEVPGNVRTAIRLMYAGFVVTVIDLLLSLMALGRYAHDANTAKNKAADYTARDRGGQGGRPDGRHAHPEHDGRRGGGRRRRRRPRARLLGVARRGDQARPRLDPGRRHASCSASTRSAR